MSTGVGRDPSGDLRVFADDSQQLPAGVLGVRGVPVDADRRPQLAERGPDQVLATEDVCALRLRQAIFGAARMPKYT
jgi:hypothetical protein